MGDRELSFRHCVIDADPPGAEHDITLIADINGDGVNEIIIGGKTGPPNLFWYENPMGGVATPKGSPRPAGDDHGDLPASRGVATPPVGLTWRRHDMAAAPQLEAGGVVVDVSGSGRLDVVAGQQIGHKLLYWFENPADPARPWPARVIEDRFEKYHDQAVGDVDGDGEVEILTLSQQAGVLVYYDIPPDPRAQPWPRECCHVIAEGLPADTEGLRVVDIDGDGVLEVVTGSAVYESVELGGPWRQVHVFGGDFGQARLAVADLTGDGKLDVVLAEGESHPGRLAVCMPFNAAPRILRDDLFHPHSLEIADFDGNGRPDIFVAEMGLGRNPDPKLIIYRNLGGGEFEEIVVSGGVPTHEAKVADLTGDGRPDIIGKPYHPQRHIDVWFNET